MKRKSHGEEFGLQTKMHNKKRVNRIKNNKKTSLKARVLWMNGSLCTLCDTLLPELNLNAAGNEMSAT